ncbi:MAG: hypothetical protein WCY88_02565 [Spongiibacteraceae bacterium]
MDDVLDEIEDKAEDFSEETQLLWQRSKKHLKGMRHNLKDASKKLETATDEGVLQAHLAAMDAHDQWLLLKNNVAMFFQYAENKSQPVIDHAKLQSHLASMDARDFMADSGKDLADKFADSREKVAKSSLKAATEIKNYFDGLIAGLPK